MRVERAALLGGTGFVGRALAARLVRAGVAVRVVARNADAAEGLPEGVTALSADVLDAAAIRRAMAECEAAVYLPGLVHGRSRRVFHDVHVRGAQSCADIARELGLQRFIFLSALGAAAGAPAWSDQTKAEGEREVARSFPGTVVVRPSLVLGPGDHFSTRMLDLMRRLPVLPVVGPGTRIQPVHIKDLADALRGLLKDPLEAGPVIQAAGPRVWTMIELLEVMRERSRVRCRLLGLPESVVLALAAVAERLPESPICRDQVRLMRTDKIADAGLADLATLGIEPADPLSGSL